MVSITKTSGRNEHFDLNAQNVTDTLKSTGLWDNTLLIISADNGGPSGTDGSAYHPITRRFGIFMMYDIHTNLPSNYIQGNTAILRVELNVNFISGGYLPEARRGISLNGIMYC